MATGNTSPAKGEGGDSIEWEHWETILSTIVHAITITMFLVGLVLVCVGVVGWEAVLPASVGWGCLLEIFFP